MPELDQIDIVFDGAPGPEGPRFIEVESPPGRSISFGEWVERPDGYWAIRFASAPALLVEVKRLREREQEETCWLIEWPGGSDSWPRWWHPVIGWTMHAHRATRFCRAEDAKTIIDTRNMVQGIKVTEHKFLSLEQASLNPKDQADG